MCTGSSYPSSPGTGSYLCFSPNSNLALDGEKTYRSGESILFVAKGNRCFCDPNTLYPRKAGKGGWGNAEKCDVTGV